MVRRIAKYLQKKSEQKNVAIIDGQNLVQGFADLYLEINYQKLVHYLRKKYSVKTLYWFLGYNKKQNKTLLQELKKAKIEPVFNKHNYGNADAHIAFTTTVMVYESNFDKIVFVSGDGDFIPLVEHLVRKNKLKKILFPTQKVASPYFEKSKTIHKQFIAYLDNKNTIEEYTTKTTSKETVFVAGR